MSTGRRRHHWSVVVSCACALFATSAARGDESEEKSPAKDAEKDFSLARSSFGELNLGIFAYVRYLNQLALKDSYTDSFGRTTPLHLRSDFQVNKVTLTFRGWLLDPKFSYRFYTWTANASQGLGAQVVVAGNVGYRIADCLRLATGIEALPTTRSTNGTFPNFLKNDHRTIADEFFRGSYTTGIWADGKLVPGLEYRVMLGNNLSQLGVDAAQLEAGPNSVAAALWWMPSTGEYGAGKGFGDYDEHTNVATLVGAHFTYSREDRQAQPGVNDFENTQIRLSDGTRIFQPDAFATGGQIQKATYRMADANAGLKYRGLSLDGEYYFRWVNRFATSGFIPVSDLFDHGFQVQGSSMLVPKLLQLYSAGSVIFGEYGTPWDASFGVNVFPFKRRELRVNLQGLLLKRSPVGYNSVPFIVGGNGWVFTADVMIAF